MHQEEAERIWVGATDGEQGSQAGTRLNLLTRPGEFSLQSLHGAIEHLTVQLLFGCEMPVDDFLRNARGRCYRLHASRGKPFCRKSGGRALENRGLALIPR
jgi:hypothetical protein